MKKLINEKNYYRVGIILYILFSISIFLGLLINEDASGKGTSNDFKNTWEYVLLLEQNYFIDASKWTRLLPFHYIFLSILYGLLGSEFLVRMLFCILSLSIPLIFYKNLRLKFKDTIKGKLLILASIILILPYFRSSAIWPNPHISALFFLLFSIYFFQKWYQSKIKKINLNFILHLIFLALTVYTRRYYVFFFLYYFLYYFKYLNIKDFLITSFFVLLLSIPGFILIINFPFYLSSIGYNFKFYNSFLIITSIFFFYIVSFIDLETLKVSNLRSKLLLCSSIILIITLSFFFDYNPKLGGGYIMKFSNIFLGGNFLFYLSSIIGTYLLSKIFFNNKENSFLIILIFFIFSNNYMFQKYFEPLWLIIFFLILNLNFVKKFLSSNFQIFIVLFFFSIYSISALINSFYSISINHFW